MTKGTDDKWNIFQGGLKENGGKQSGKNDDGRGQRMPKLTVKIEIETFSD